jgi:hypothetical protein
MRDLTCCVTMEWFDVFYLIALIHVSDRVVVWGIGIRLGGARCITHGALQMEHGLKQGGGQ